MKLSLICFFALFLLYSGCSKDDTVSPPPSTGEVLLATVAFDSIGSAGSSVNVSQTVSLTSSQLNFTDRDSARISFSYKGASTANDTLFYITTGSSRLYTLRDASVTGTYKNINVTVPAIRVNDFFRYTIQARGTSPFITIKDLNVYKK